MENLFGEDQAEDSYIAKLRVSMRKAIALARERQALRLAIGKAPAEVTLTLSEVMALLAKQDYRCALSRIMFYSLGGGSYNPSRPSIDRIEHSGPYSLGNVRIVLLGVNMLRGTGSDRDMYIIAKALAATAR